MDGVIFGKTDSMNFPLLTAILQSDLPCAQRMILTVLLNHEGKDGRIYPSRETIAKQAGLCERASRGHLKALLKSPWLSKDGRNYTISKPAESATSNRQILPVPQQENRQKLPESPIKNRQNLPPKPAESAAEPAKSAEKTGIICPLNSTEPPNNHPITKSPEAPPIKTSKPDWREFNRTLATKANAIQTPLLSPPEFREAWQRYQSYRTNRACESRISSEALLWTEDAASAALRGCERAADGEGGWMAVCTRIDEAIAGRWQGLNLDKAQPRTNGFHQLKRPTQAETRRAREIETVHTADTLPRL